MENLTMKLLLVLGGLMGALLNTPTAQAAPLCFEEKLNVYNLRKSLGRDNGDYSGVNRRYEALARVIDGNALRVVGRINVYSGKINGIFLQMGLEGITALTNGLVCEPGSAFYTFCNANKGKFISLAKSYAKMLGLRRANIMALEGVTRTYGSKQRRLYAQAIDKWITMLGEINLLHDAQVALNTCTAPIDTTEVIDKCNLPPGAAPPPGPFDFFGWLRGFISGLLNSLFDLVTGEKATEDLARFDPGPGCPRPPFAPRAFTRSDNGCLKLGGVAEAIGLVFCDDSLATDAL